MRLISEYPPTVVHVLLVEFVGDMDDPVDLEPILDEGVRFWARRLQASEEELGLGLESVDQNSKIIGAHLVTLPELVVKEIEHEDLKIF